MRIINAYLFGANRSDYRPFNRYSHNKHATVIPTQKHKMASVTDFCFKNSIKLDLREADVDLANSDYMFGKQVSTSALDSDSMLQVMPVHN